MTETERLINAIHESRDILLLTHLNPDGDAAGSTLALALALKALGKNVVAACDGELPRKFAFMKELGDLVKPEEVTGEFHLCIALDCADLIRFGAARELFEGLHRTANIDHHRTNPLFADINIVKNVSSTGEIVYPIIKELTEVTGDIASLIYASMATDTGNFTYSNVTPGAFAIMAEICGKYDHERIAARVFSSRTFEDARLIAATIDSMELYHNGEIGVAYLNFCDIAGLGETPDYETAITYVTNVDTVRISIFLRQLGINSYKVSLRSKGDIDVSALAAQYGGGGHKNASGARMNASLRDCVAELVERAGQLL